MPVSESMLLKMVIPILKSVGIWWFLQKRSKSKLCRLCKSLANDYSGSPQNAERMYSILVVLFRYPLIRESREITVNMQCIYELDTMVALHEKCKDLFSNTQNRSICAILNTIKKINEKTETIDLREENIEAQKNIARQLLIDWCYVVFMLNKIGNNGSNFTPLNNDPNDLNQVIRQRFRVSLDENQLFAKQLSQYGIEIKNIE